MDHHRNRIWKTGLIAIMLVVDLPHLIGFVLFAAVKWSNTSRKVDLSCLRISHPDWLKNAPVLTQIRFCWGVSKIKKKLAIYCMSTLLLCVFTYIGKKSYFISGAPARSVVFSSPIRHSTICLIGSWPLSLLCTLCAFFLFLFMKWQAANKLPSSQSACHGKLPLGAGISTGNQPGLWKEELADHFH